MATPASAITEWDAQGNPVTPAVSEWDAKGNPITSTTQRAAQAPAPPAGQVEPAPFPVDDWVRHQLKDLPPEEKTKQTSGFTSVAHTLAKPWMDMGYSAAAGLNRGIAHFSTTLDLAFKNLASTNPDQGPILGKVADQFEKAAKEYEQNTEFWQGLISKEGVDGINKLIGNAIGSAGPGTAEFLLDVASGFSVPFLASEEKAREEHQTDPAIGGLIEAAKTGTLALLFRGIAPFNRYLQATAMGAAFGVQDATEAPKGKRFEAFGQGAATGAMLGLAQPGGGLGLKDIYPEVGPRSAPEPAAPTEQESETPTTGKPAQDATIQRGTKEGGVTTGAPGTTRHIFDMENKLVESGKIEQEDVSFLRRQALDAWMDAGRPGLREDYYAAALRRLGSNTTNAPAPAAELESGSAPTPSEEERVTHDPDIRELTDALKNVPRDTSFEDRMSLADTLKKTYDGVLGKAQTATAAMKATGKAAWDFYNKPPQWTNFDDMFGKFLGARQKTGIEIDRFGKQIIDSMPNREQQAVTRYMQANGDEAVLRDWADRTTDPEVKQKYEDALKLPDETKNFAKSVRSYWDGKLDDMIQAGVLEDGIENYVTQAWAKDKDNPVAQRLLAEAYSGKLSKNPSFAKKRIFESYFEGEQAGYTPKDDRIGYLISSYEKMADHTLAARQFITSLSGGRVGPEDVTAQRMENSTEGVRARGANASDGRPLVVTKGTGKRVPKGEEPAEAYLINPNSVGPVFARDAKGKVLRVAPDDVTEQPMGNAARGVPIEINTQDYRTIDHPALRNHKWVAIAETAPDGSPIFLQGDVKVHPEIYDRLNNFLGHSAVRDSLAGRVALRGSAEVKGTLLGFFSPFHQVHLSQTAATHGVNPLRDVLPDKIDLDDPVTSKLIDHSLKVYDSDGMAAFSEGADTAGLERFIPFVGKYSEMYQQYLFGADGFIPRLKIHFAKVAYERNAKTYPELSDDQVLKLSSDQANAAFGGQNLEFMGRNKTTQDLLRLGALAPNFLESRARSAAQALMPYGREQFTALVIRGAIGMYVAAKITEGIAHMVDPDTNKIHWDKPFSATIDGKEYSIRSEQGDIYHLISDWRSFIYFRLSPALAKPAVEAITGRDNWGRKKDIGAQIKDWATAAVPMAGQGFFNKQDYNLYQSILQSVGVSSWNARTNAEQLVMQIEGEKNKEVLPAATQKRMQARGKLGESFEENGDFEPIRKAVEEGKITPGDIKSILQRSIKGDVLRGVTGFSVPDALQVWDQANDDEKAAIQMEIIKKWFGWPATAEERQSYAAQIEKVISWKPANPVKSKRFSVRGQ